VLTHLLVLGYAAAIATMAYVVMDPSWAPDALELNPSGGVELPWWRILATNGAAALMLFSGAATGGLTTLAALTWTGAYVGATMSVAVTNVGVGTVAADVWLFLPLEIAGLVVAAAAGLHPVVLGLLDPHREGDGFARRYLAGARGSLRLLPVAGALLLAAAVAEALTGA
jgi:uncharacterized membrane protein SpoIIM required for sporulation